jgi:hypothetical protein
MRRYECSISKRFLIPGCSCALLPRFIRQSEGPAAIMVAAGHTSLKRDLHLIQYSGQPSSCRGGFTAAGLMPIGFQG